VPQQRAYIERVIGTIRRECLDHLIIVNEAALHPHLKLSLEYYHGTRTHLSLEKDTPESRSVQPPESGRVEIGGEQVGAAAGILNAAGNIVGFFSPLVTPYVASKVGWACGLWVGALLSILGAVACYFVDLREAAEGAAERAGAPA
jgi:hypothetical protein